MGQPVRACAASKVEKAPLLSATRAFSFFELYIQETGYIYIYMYRCVYTCVHGVIQTVAVVVDD